METNELYNQEDIKTMRTAEQSRMPGKNRVEELKNYALKAGIKKIGIANCVCMQKETNQLKEVLEKDFEVFSVDCKVGKVKSSDLLQDDSKGVSCNPAGQAQYLKDNETELNIVAGLCVGHDIVFNQKSHAPVTHLLIKDREFKHNPYQYFSENK